MAVNGRQPYKVLISCILSLRTQDRTTARASERLFGLACTPEAMCSLDVEEIERAIYPVGFYRVKAVNIKAISQRLFDEYGGVVPDVIDELLKFKGVGRKTANLVVTV
ncbi:MAG: endonuclease III, partial [Nitrospirae bacterium]|nr:endonuclease III [Nitrospirota bacterium]